MDPGAAAWLAEYALKVDLYDEAALLARKEIVEVLKGKPLSIHSVEARAKTPSSAYAKVKKKGYSDPVAEMTDVLGVRIITNYSLDIAEVVNRLKSKFEVDVANSIDKRQILGVSEFGYRSVHLILYIRKPSVVGVAAELLKSIKVEVQVRTIAEHAWAEAEHSLKYKSGIDIPDDLNRRFNALAATLELVDREFDALTTGLIELVQKYTEQYKNGALLDVEMDSARFLAFMSTVRPDAVVLGPKPLLLPFRRVAECVAALKEVGITTAAALNDALESAEFLAIVRDYADELTVEPEAVSVAVCVSSVIALSNVSVLDDYPVLNDSRIRNLVSPIESAEEVNSPSLDP